MKLYLDTSIISAYFDFLKPVRQLITVKWISHDAKNFDLFISNLVILEISATKDQELREKMISLIAKIKPQVLEMNETIEDLAKQYREKIIPKEINDSLHIATAVSHKMDAIVSWNFKHIVNLRTISEIHKINMMNKLTLLEILSPENLGGEIYGDV